MKRVLFGFFVSFVFSSSALAELPWTVAAIKGTGAQIVSSGKSTLAKVGDAISLGQELRSEKARLKLVRGRSVLQIAENTTLRFERLEETERRPTVNITRGAIRANLDVKEAKEYEYKIPSAVAGVRGTEIYFKAQPEQEVICVLKGEVAARELIKLKRSAVLQKNIGWIRDGDKDPVIVETKDDQRKGWTSEVEI